MLKTIKLFLKAKNIVDKYEKIALNDQSVLKDKHLGFHLTFDPIEEPQKYEQLLQIMKRSFPYRSHNGMHIKTLDGKNLISSGNELENDINGEQLNANQWSKVVIGMHKRHKKDLDKICSPALMTIKQKKDFWPKIKHLEDHFSYWCLNSHMPAFQNRLKSQLGYYLERIKCVMELIKFKESTKKPIIFTELGVGENWLLTRSDVTYLYLVHKHIFGDRMLIGLYYNSDLMQRNMGYNQIEQR